MVATADNVKPSVLCELIEAQQWLEEHDSLKPQEVEVNESGVKIVFPRDCCDAFREVFKGQPATLHRGSYGTNWYVVTRNRWRFECYTPKLPDSETVTL